MLNNFIKSKLDQFLFKDFQEYKQMMSILMSKNNLEYFLPRIRLSHFNKQFNLNPNSFKPNFIDQNQQTSHVLCKISKGSEKG